MENDSLEVKGWCTDERQLTEKIADASSCLANAGGGVVLIGIEDGMGPRRFSRCPFPNVSVSWLMARAQDNTHPPVICRALDVSKELADVTTVPDVNAYALIVERKKCLSGHVTSKGICRTRSGKECKPVFAAEDDRTKVIVPEAGPQDLLLGSIQWAMSQHNRYFQRAEPFADTTEFLSAAGLLLPEESAGGRVTLAALLLYGKEVALMRNGIACETIVQLPTGTRVHRKNVIESPRELALTEHAQ